ncbi:serine/threonine protein kinase RIO2 [Histoplasma capsulatum H143]|uniref:Serine/threonine protein kinase RIO2 n=1 Tax=Ajellomyces capsulatus (strain H143) TaxID=544712 RepID=C6HL16_AJECH|nr:serine/threonine protein kinase RIO2 [Histoplasma capsulatum H143]
MKLDPKAMRYLAAEDFRTLAAVEMGSRNHEVVPTPLIVQLSGLRGGSIVHKCISNLAKINLIARVKNARYDGYRLTYGGLDYLALNSHQKQKSIYSEEVVRSETARGKRKEGGDGAEGENINLIPILIDFPQMVSVDHPNAEMYFERRFGFASDEKGPFFKDAKKLVGTKKGGARLDVEVEASGFSRKMARELEAYMKEMGVDGDGGENGERDDLRSDDEGNEDEENEEDSEEEGENEDDGVPLGDEVDAFGNTIQKKSEVEQPKISESESTKEIGIEQLRISDSKLQAA